MKDAKLTSFTIFSSLFFNCFLDKFFVCFNIFLQNEALRDEANQGNQCQPDPLIPWLNAAIKDKRIQAKDPELAAKMFRGLIEGSINYPALYGPQKTAAELKPLKEEIIALFLSRYG